MNLKNELQQLAGRLSKYLNACASRLPLQLRKWVGGTLGLGVAVLCIVMIARPFYTGYHAVVIERRRMPITIVPPQGEPFLSVEDRAFLAGFKTMMDSLKVHDLDTYAKMIRGREGLLDSVELILKHP
jgi:hypothetical protein